MLKIIMLFFMFVFLSVEVQAKKITPNEVFSQVELIAKHTNSLLAYYGIKYNQKKTTNKEKIYAHLRPRNVWQKTYEIMIKINILRKTHNLPIIEPVNLEPVLDLHPDLVYEQTQRILTEILIYKTRMGISIKHYKHKEYMNKTPLDVYNALSYVSASFDKLNKTGFTPSYVFGETMRIHDDLSTILEHLNINDKTVPSIRNENATPKDTFTIAMRMLEKITKVQHSVGLRGVDFSPFYKKDPTPSDVFSIVQMVIAELQVIKAQIGLKTYITPAATSYILKTPSDVEQLMSWNLNKISLIESLRKGRQVR